MRIVPDDRPVASDEWLRKLWVDSHFNAMTAIPIPETESVRRKPCKTISSTRLLPRMPPD